MILLSVQGRSIYDPDRIAQKCWCWHNVYARNVRRRFCFSGIAATSPWAGGVIEMRDESFFLSVVCRGRSASISGSFRCFLPGWFVCSWPFQQTVPSCSGSVPEGLELCCNEACHLRSPPRSAPNSSWIDSPLKSPPRAPHTFTCWWRNQSSSCVSLVWCSMKWTSL